MTIETFVNHRRSKRIFIQIPVRLTGSLPDQSNFEEKAQTIVVNEHGALVELTRPLEQGQNVILENGRTSEAKESKVVLVMPGDSGNFHVAVEFINPSPSFWQINFPPEGWSPRHPHAKSSKDQ
jgi:hypothetical protein